MILDGEGSEYAFALESSHSHICHRCRSLFLIETVSPDLLHLNNELLI